MPDTFRRIKIIYDLFEIIENIVILEISNLENGLWAENAEYILDRYNEEK